MFTSIDFWSHKLIIIFGRRELNLGNISRWSVIMASAVTSRYAQHTMGQILNLKNQYLV